jgi:hypothetical protein
MDHKHSARRRAFLTALLAGGVCATAYAHGIAPSPFVKSNLVQVDVYDRASGAALPVYAKDGRHYIVGVPGHEYAVRIRNCTGARILAVTSVDGVNVISGDTASPAQSGYVLEPWGSVEIAGWRKSFERTAAFYFTDLGDSYAARTGRPQNVGVIGVAVFQERVRRIGWRDEFNRKQATNEAQPSADKAERRSDASGAGRADASAESRADAPAVAAPAPLQAPRESAAADARARQQLAESSAPRMLGKIGTGHGRSEESRATTVNFDRATSVPAETVAIQYDRRENLAALGVLPQPTPYYARRDPEPFPARVRFAPDPVR